MAINPIVSIKNLPLYNDEESPDDFLNWLKKYPIANSIKVIPTPKALKK